MKGCLKEVIGGFRLIKIIGVKRTLRLIFNRFFTKPEHRNKVRQKIKLEYIHKRFLHLKRRCQSAPFATGENNGPVWVCWWQGEKQMPELVRMCYRRLLEAARPQREVVLITKDNYSSYVEIPDYILRKVKSRIISLTHFSDILRMSLLAKHGGLWIDATVYVHGKLPENIFKTPYFSGKAPYDERFVSRCEYTLFLIGSVPQAPWMIYARDVMFEYWKTANRVLEYSFTDYILISAMDSIPELRKEIVSSIVETPYIHTLETLCNEPCDEMFFDKMMNLCSFYKLSYKIDLKERTDTGKLTYWGYLKKQKENDGYFKECLDKR